MFDKKADGPRFVFHTAFDDPATPCDAPPRKSIEVRAIAFYDPPPLGFEDAEQDHTQCYYCTSSAYLVKSTEC